MTTIISNAWYNIRKMDVLRMVLVVATLYFALEVLKAGLAGDVLWVCCNAYFTFIAAWCVRMSQYYSGTLRVKKHVLRKVIIRRNLLLGDARYELYRDNAWLRDRWTIRDRKAHGVIDDETVKRWIVRYLGCEDPLPWE